MATQFDAKGRPKVARDRKSEFRMERITAGVARDCRANCGYLIVKGERFARLTHPGLTKRIGRRNLLDPVDYHFDCVPEGAKPLVRFLRF